MTIFVRRGLILLACSVLAGCGFHLRNDAALPSSLEPIYIGGSAANGPLAQILRYQLTNSNTKVAARAADANYQLILHSEGQSRRIISLDRRGLAAEYGITSAVQFELHDKAGRRVLGPQTIEERRTITNNPDNALTTSQDISIVTADMNQVLAAQVVRRLGAYAKYPRPPVEQSAPTAADAPAAAPTN